MTEKERHALLTRTVLLQLAGIAVSMAIGGLIAWQLPPGVTRLALSTAATALGLLATGVIAWQMSRSLAGDERRTGMISALGFVAIHEREWLSLFPLEGHHMVISAQFVLTFVAFGFAVLVYAWLQPLDAREAEANAARGPSGAVR